MAAVTGSNGLWSSRALEITVRRGGQIVVERRLTQPFARVGSHPSADVPLADVEPSGCQLYLHGTNEGVYCFGLLPGTPTGWVREKGYAPLGEYRVYARFADDGPPPVAPAEELRQRGGDGDEWPQIVIRSRHGTKIKRRLPGRLTVVGRNQRSTLRFEDDSVCDAHCALYWDGQNMWVIDLLSVTGTLLDGRRVNAEHLPAGHDLLIGNNRLHWRLTVDVEALQSTVVELRARLAESEHDRQKLANGLMEQQAEVDRLTAAQNQSVLNHATLNHANRPVPADTGRADHEPGTTDNAHGLLGEELIERLMDFKSKRERGGFRRRLMWTAVVVAIVVALGAVTVAVGRPWLNAHVWPDSNVAQPSLGEYPVVR
jgi:hypothetical protein